MSNNRLYVTIADRIPKDDFQALSELKQRLKKRDRKTQQATGEHRGRSGDINHRSVDKRG